MKKDESASGEHRHQSSGRKMEEEDVGVTVSLLQTSGTEGCFYWTSSRAARGPVQSFILDSCPYLAGINVLLSAGLFSGGLTFLSLNISFLAAYFPSRRQD